MTGGSATSMITFPPYPIPVITPLGEGYVIYVTESGMHENDCVCVALATDGQWRHFNTGQLKSHKNATYEIVKTEPSENEKPNTVNY